MTIREEVNAKKRTIVTYAYFGFGLFVVGITLSRARPILNIMAAAGLAIASVMMAYAYVFAFRCPSCRGNWRAFAMNSGRSPFTIDPNIKYCPYCRVDLDSKSPAAKTTDEPGCDA